MAVAWRTFVCLHCTDSMSNPINALECVNAPKHCPHCTASKALLYHCVG